MIWPLRLLFGSLAVNLAFGVVWVWRSLQSSAVHSAISQEPTQTSSVSLPSAATETPDAFLTPTWSTLDADDPQTLLARLRAAEISPRWIRAILRARLNTARAEQARLQLAELDKSTEDSADEPSLRAKRLALLRKLNRETEREVRSLLGEDVSLAERARSFGNLPLAKIEALRRLEEDYRELLLQARGPSSHRLMPDVPNALELLDRERHADLEALLTPEELADYNARNSPVTHRLRTAFTLMDATADEFRTILEIYQSQPELKGSYLVGLSSIPREQRQEAEARVSAQIAAALGPERFADYVHGTSREYQVLIALIQRENLPADTATSTFIHREAAARESQRLANDASLTSAQQLTALRELARRTRTDILQQLGPKVGPEYLMTAERWLQAIEKGNGLTFGPEDRQALDPVSARSSMPRR